MGMAQVDLEGPPRAAHPALVQCPGWDLKEMDCQGVTGAKCYLCLAPCNLPPATGGTTLSPFFPRKPQTNACQWHVFFSPLDTLEGFVDSVGVCWMTGGISSPRKTVWFCLYSPLSFLSSEDVSSPLCQPHLYL